MEKNTKSQEKQTKKCVYNSLEKYVQCLLLDVFAMNNNIELFSHRTNISDISGAAGAGPTHALESFRSRGYGFTN